MIERGFDVGLKNEYGYAALHLVALSGNARMCTTLLSSKSFFTNHKTRLAPHCVIAESKPNSTITPRSDTEPPDQHAYNTHLETLAPCDVSALYLSSERGHLQVVNQLLSAGADPRRAYTLNAQRGVTALHAAAARGRVEVTEALLSAGADPNASMNISYPPEIATTTAPHQSTADPEQVLPCDNKQFVNTQTGAALCTSGMWCAGVSGVQPLHLAVQGGHLATMQLLLASGADINKHTSVTDTNRAPASVTAEPHGSSSALRPPVTGQSCSSDRAHVNQCHVTVVNNNKAESVSVSERVHGPPAPITRPDSSCTERYTGCQVDTDQTFV